MQITGIILAGGLNTRMGTDKALIQMNGKTLLEKAIEICKPVCKSIIISSNNKNHEFCGYQITPDEIKNCGPMGGIYACLLKSDTDWNFIISVDAVFVEPEFVQFLISNTGKYDAAVPVHQNGKEPLIAMYHKNCIPTFETSINSGDFKMHNLLAKINVNEINSGEWIQKYPRLFLNLNKPGDLNFSE
jgi:molybdopterin-guanine dinucleotide biosynthesis protein A